MVVGTIKGVTL